MKNILKGYGATRHISDEMAEILLKQPHRGVSKEVKKDPNPLLEIVYAPDERTGLPNSDISVYLGKNCRPEIRQFIQDNLMGNSYPVNFGTSDVDADTIMELTRNVDESQHEYASRITNYIKLNGEKFKFEQKMNSIKSDKSDN